jgi:proteic killer suppression protein
VIKSFRCADTEKLAGGTRVRRFVNFERVAQRKLAILDAARTLEDCSVPPGNRLEKLAGDREGQHSIRINDQWRICFEWRDDCRHEVEIVDYH